MEGRELQSLKEIGKSLVREVGRLADSNEAIVKLASEEHELANMPQPGPPFCPHCGTFDPPVMQHAAGGGPMSTFVLAAQCGGCGKTLYGIPEGWQVFSTPDDAKAALETRGGSDNGNS